MKKGKGMKRQTLQRKRKGGCPEKYGCKPLASSSFRLAPSATVNSSSTSFPDTVSSISSSKLPAPTDKPTLYRDLELIEISGSQEKQSLPSAASLHHQHRSFRKPQVLGTAALEGSRRNLMDSDNLQNLLLPFASSDPFQTKLFQRRTEPFTRGTRCSKPGLTHVCLWPEFHQEIHPGTLC